MSLKNTIRIGRIDYLNALPFYHGLAERLEGRSIEFVRGVPAEINRLMREERVDAALISSLEYALSPDAYYVLSDTCVGARAAMESVVLFSRFTWDQLNKKTITLSTDSLSSAALLKILLAGKWGFTNLFNARSGTVEEAMKKSDAALAIGDRALFHAQDKTRTYHALDLSSEWARWQKLPFCFALWVVRRSWADRDRTGAQALSECIQENVRANTADLRRMWREAEGIKASPLSEQAALDYFSSLTYTLDPEMLQGLERFYELARQGNILTREILLEYPEFLTAEVK